MMNQLAALLVGKAVRTVFPKEIYFGSEVGGLGFSCSFSYAGKFDASLLDMIERAIEAVEIQEMEMVTSNAGELFDHLGLVKLAEKARGMDGVVQIARMDAFADFYEGELGDWGCAALLGFEQEKGRVRIFGRAFERKDERKAFLKKYQDYREAAHWGKELELFEGNLWLPRGMALKHILETYWRECLETGGLVEVGGSGEVPFERYGYWEGLDDHVMGKGLDSWIATSMEKFGFMLRNLKLVDPLGIEREGPYFEKGRGALYGNLDAFVKLLLEGYQGELPFWLAPEQMRLLVVEGADADAIKEILNRNRIRYKVDVEEGPLREKMQRALHIKVPYVIFFGKREEVAKSITIRAFSSKRDDIITYEKFETFVQERK